MRSSFLLLFIFFFAVLLQPGLSYAEDSVKPVDEATSVVEKTAAELAKLPELVAPTNSGVSVAERAINFGVIYAFQWGFFLVSQREEIEKYGSWDNWRKHPFELHYDKDSFDYNLIKHTFVGQYYYLWYRSRGYSMQSAFVWSYLSSFAFEFTIETVTEPPSLQDLYQTPVFGTVLGIGTEKLSLYFHSYNNWYGHTLGYLLNPFSILPSTKNVFGLAYFDHEQVNAVVTWEF